MADRVKPKTDDEVARAILDHIAEATRQGRTPDIEMWVTAIRVNVRQNQKDIRTAILEFPGWRGKKGKTAAIAASLQDWFLATLGV